MIIFVGVLMGKVLLIKNQYQFIDYYGNGDNGFREGR